MSMNINTTVAFIFFALSAYLGAALILVNQGGTRRLLEGRRLLEEIRFTTTDILRHATHKHFAGNTSTCDRLWSIR